ncbi:GFA family protein [Pelagibius sp. Alg239-R121]|uniref:GFA family protein n=1 Tax=Pelagibius sp. Alg239-R121 TaxID=2993448 RepID=UPI0024A76DBF|nr:GFA family protein [Pelagibius sp. Alg239-R121]
MIHGSCHCGAVTFELLEQPKWLTDCNCSVCRRIGALWAHADVGKIKVSCADDATIGYITGDKTLIIRSCKTCGSTTHWENLDPPRHKHMAVNCRMADPEDIASLRIRRFDGAENWEYLD